MPGSSPCVPHRLVSRQRYVLFRLGGVNDVQRKFFAERGNHAFCGLERIVVDHDGGWVQRPPVSWRDIPRRSFSNIRGRLYVHIQTAILSVEVPLNGLRSGDLVRIEEVGGPEISFFEAMLNYMNNPQYTSFKTSHWTVLNFSNAFITISSLFSGALYSSNMHFASSFSFPVSKNLMHEWSDPIKTFNSPGSSDNDRFAHCYKLKHLVRVHEIGIRVLLLRNQADICFCPSNFTILSNGTKP